MVWESQRTTPCKSCGEESPAKNVGGVTVYRCPMCDARHCEKCGAYIADAFELRCQCGHALQVSLPL